MKKYVGKKIIVAQGFEATSATVITSASLTCALESCLCSQALSRSSIKQYIARVQSHISSPLFVKLFGDKILKEDFYFFKYQLATWVNYLPDTHGAVPAAH